VLRLVEIPLVIRLPGMQQVARGAQVRLDIVRWDEVDLSLEARLLEVAEPTPEAAAALEFEEEEEAAATNADTGEAAAEEAVEAEGSVTVTDPVTQTDVPAA
jgi:exoribonuclease-2